MEFFETMHQFFEFLLVNNIDLGYPEIFLLEIFHTEFISNVLQMKISESTELQSY